MAQDWYPYNIYFLGNISKRTLQFHSFLPESSTTKVLSSQTLSARGKRKGFAMVNIITLISQILPLLRVK
jgi:hypothetical protein